MSEVCSAALLCVCIQLMVAPTWLMILDNHMRHSVCEKLWLCIADI